MEKLSYASRSNLEYVESLYQVFLNKPDDVSSEWRMFFEGVEFAKQLPDSSHVSSKELDVFNLIRAYRDYGAFEANLNPLMSGNKSFPELSFDKFNLSEKDFDTVFEIGSIVGKPKSTLRDIIAHLRQSYCGTISVQVADAMPTVREWFFAEFEQNRSGFTLSNENKKEILHSLARAESFEKFIHTRYVGKKRFSIEGGDALIPMMERLTECGVQNGVEEIVIGMAHRGRLNMLANFLGKAIETMFAEFDGLYDKSDPEFDGDVKYHLGFECDRPGAYGTCRMNLAYNPSHLEAVDPVVIGMVRARQRRRKDTAERKRVVPVLIHGDAAFAGQGVVMETLQMSQLKGYTVGGTVHVIVDNQVGFTATPDNTRSSPHSSDVAKILHTPVLQVNGDDVEACVRAADIAMRFRQEFKRDIVINITCYRRYGHNEGDEPAFTSPLMYEKIKKHPTLYSIYTQKLIMDGVIDQHHAEALTKTKIENLQGILDQVRKSPPEIKTKSFTGLWEGLRKATTEDFAKETKTAVDIKILKKTGEILTTLPTEFTPHTKITKLLQDRKNMMDGEGKIDWGLAELMAYGTLMFEGTPIRISGQDCVRGTFTHRHSVFTDVKTGEKYSPLATIKPDEVEFCIYDSLLSEFAVLGFEYGNSSTDPKFLTVWEAQFGDFANGAQIIIDQFLSSGEAKWQQMSGLVLLLPHGYEGQGPEHSSARLERFLQLCAQKNMQVVNMTSPAQIFHALRRQIRRDFRKPLIVMSPKSLLRHPKVLSTWDDLSKGSFQEVIGDTEAEKKKVKNLVLCSGKVYFDLAEHREKVMGTYQPKPGETVSEYTDAERKLVESTALVRIEQLYPWPEHRLLPIIESYAGLKKITWTQEEPKNMGAWFFVWPRLLDLVAKLKLDIEVVYAGRTDRASPATGSEKRHHYEQQEILNSAFGLKKK